MLFRSLLRLCQVTQVSADATRLSVHLYDTVNFGSEADDERAWSQPMFPTYLAADYGLVVRKHEEVLDETAVVTQVTSADVLDVPFKLAPSNRLKGAQLKVINRWITQEEEEENVWVRVTRVVRSLPSWFSGSSTPPTSL